MATTSKTLTANGSNGYHKLTLNVSVDTDTQDAVQNTSIVSYSVTLSPIANTGTHGWNYADTDPFTCNYSINGVSHTCTLRTYNGTSTVTLASGTQIVQHQVTGTKTVGLVIKGFSQSDPNLIGSFSANDTFTLPSMDRVAKFTVPTGTHTLNTQFAITYTNLITDLKVRLSYSVGTASAVISYVTVNSTTISQSWTPPTSLASQDIYHDTLSCVLTLETIYMNGNDEILVGIYTETITLTVPSGRPTYNIQVLDVNGYENTLGVYINGMSTVCVNLYQITCQYSAQVKSVNIVLKKTNASGDVIAEGATLVSRPSGDSYRLYWNCNWTGTVYAQVTITDTRNRVKNDTYSTAAVVEDYFAPIVDFSVERYTDQAGTTQDDGGDYGKVTYDVTYSSTGSNSAVVKISYKQHAASSWSTLLDTTATLSGSTSTFTALRNKTYDVLIEVTDSLQTVSYTALLSTAVTFMDWAKDGDAISFGKPLAETSAMEVGWGKIVIDNVNANFPNSTDQKNTELRFKRRDNTYQVSLYAPDTSDPGLEFCFYKESDANWTYSMLANKTGLYPYHQDTENLGSSTRRWQTIYGNSIYGNTIYENGTSLANKYAPIVSVVESAANLGWGNSSTSTVASATWTTLGSYAFPVGRYLVLTRVEFAGNATGNRQMMWTTSSTSSGTPSAWTQQSYETKAGCTGWTNLQSVFYVNITSAATRYLRVYQNSGSALATYVYVQIIAV